SGSLHNRWCSCFSTASVEIVDARHIDEARTARMRNTRLFNAVYGSLVGGAIGDAMGGATEMMTYEHISHVFGVVNSLHRRGATPEAARFEPGAPAGQVTDDTRLRNLLCGAIILKGGR